jgi:hypothetical protein
MRSLDEVAASLPFEVDDYEAANEAFARWHARRSPADREIVEVWVYCYVRRYFIVKFLRNTHLDPSGMERPIGEVYRRVCTSLETISDPTRFAGYVSVACLNAFLNSARREARWQRRLVTSDAPPEIPVVEDPGSVHDTALLRHAFERAIARLPDSLRDIAHRRLLGQETYEALEASTGHSRATLRSYVNKAMGRLREDPLLRSLLDEWQD